MIHFICWCHSNTLIFGFEVSATSAGKRAIALRGLGW